MNAGGEICGRTAAVPVWMAGREARAAFIAKTYAHLFAAILAFVGIEVALFATGASVPIAKALLGGSWLLVLGGFILVSWIASHVAFRAVSLAAQYAALAVYVLAEAIIFVPLLYVAEFYAKGAIASAAYVSLAGFAALTAVAFWTRQDFSFLRGILAWGGLVALGLIVAALLFGFELGLLFSFGMVALAGAAILYDTSKVLHEYPEDRYVGAALSLFASVALLFWYVLRIFLGSRR
jgi:FtsH-binding integral membrane protein